MKKKTLGTVTGVVMVVVITWFVGNYIHLLNARTVEDAVLVVIYKYEPDIQGRSLKVEERESQSVFPQGKIQKYVVIDGDKPIATVTLLNFLGLGWQERSYESM